MFIYKIVPRSLWVRACASGVLTGAPVDHRDGFIHFSTAAQVARTADRHFAGQKDLLLLRVREAALGRALRYETSRDNALFPHLYGVLPVDLVEQALPFAVGQDGRFSFTELT